MAAAAPKLRLTAKSGPAAAKVETTEEPAAAAETTGEPAAPAIQRQAATSFGAAILTGDSESKTSADKGDEQSESEESESSSAVTTTSPSRPAAAAAEPQPPDAESTVQLMLRIFDTGAQKLQVDELEKLPQVVKTLNQACQAQKLPNQILDTIALELEGRLHPHHNAMQTFSELRSWRSGQPFWVSVPNTERPSVLVTGSRSNGASRVLMRAETLLEMLDSCMDLDYLTRVGHMKLTEAATRQLCRMGFQSKVWRSTLEGGKKRREENMGAGSGLHCEPWHGSADPESFKTLTIVGFELGPVTSYAANSRTILLQTPPGASVVSLNECKSYLDMWLHAVCCEKNRQLVALGGEDLGIDLPWPFERRTLGLPVIAWIKVEFHPGSGSREGSSSSTAVGTWWSTSTWTGGWSDAGTQWQKRRRW